VVGRQRCSRARSAYNCWVRLLQLPACSSLCGPNQHLFHCPLWQLTQWAGACWVPRCFGLWGWIAERLQQWTGQHSTAGLAWMCGLGSPFEVLAQPLEWRQFLLAASSLYDRMAGAVAYWFVCWCICASAHRMFREGGERAPVHAVVGCWSI
jgi:hypothetical protein